MPVEGRGEGLREGSGGDGCLFYGDGGWAGDLGEMGGRMVVWRVAALAERRWMKGEDEGIEVKAMGSPCGSGGV